VDYDALLWSFTHLPDYNMVITQKTTIRRVVTVIGGASAVVKWVKASQAVLLSMLLFGHVSALFLV
jgi:hypothetical protein